MEDRRIANDLRPHRISTRLCLAIAVARLVLAMALYRDGQLAEARKTLEAAVLSYEWKATQARDVYAWICHVLRREAEGLIFRSAPAFGRGDHQPG